MLTPELKSRTTAIFETIYYLYDIAVISPSFEWIVRKLMRFKVPAPIRFLLLIPRMLREKKFYNISFISGLRFFLHTSVPQNRTKNFNNYLP